MILVVDDHLDTGNVLVRLLRRAGQDAIAVTGGAEALALLRVRKPAVMILDVQMPEMDGMTVLRKMKESCQCKDVPVLMYSADTHHDTMVLARRLGAADFVVKGSVSFAKLVSRVCELAGEPPTGNFQ